MGKMCPKCGSREVILFDYILLPDGYTYPIVGYTLHCVDCWEYFSEDLHGVAIEDIEEYRKQIMNERDKK